MTAWPLQRDCNTFYGNPRGPDGGPSAKWEAANLTTIRPPYRMTYAGKPIKAIRVHRKCADSLLRILGAIWEAAGRRQAVVDAWGASTYGGAYNYRLMRGGTALSMHSWGCAIDLDPVNNGLGDQTPKFDQHPEVMAAFEAEGWEWGGSWSKRDGMHWQAAWTRPGGVPWRPKGAARPVSLMSEAEGEPLPPDEPEADDESDAAVGDRYTDEHRVTLVQTWLRNLGYTEVGQPNGEIGPFTEAAIGAYRADKGLPAGTFIDDRLMLALATDTEPRKLAASRTEATPAQVRARVPEVRANFLTRIWSWVLGIGGAIVAFVQGVLENIGAARRHLYPVQDFLGSVPAWAWGLGALGIAVALYLISRRGERAGEAAFKDGSRR